MTIGYGAEIRVASGSPLATRDVNRLQRDLHKFADRATAVVDRDRTLLLVAFEPERPTSASCPVGARVIHMWSTAMRVVAGAIPKLVVVGDPTVWVLP